jgi:hypothetical protein
MKLSYQIKSDNSKVNCVFDFTEYDKYPLTITNVGGLEKEKIKKMFMETMDVLFESAWDSQS